MCVRVGVSGYRPELKMGKGLLRNSIKILQKKANSVFFYLHGHNVLLAKIL